MEYLVVEYLSTKEITRLFSGVVINRETGCWERTLGFINRHHHSMMRYSGGRELVHRLVYAWVFGPIPKGRGRDIPILDHIVCNNPPCCNPLHLELSTHSKNILRGRSEAARHAAQTHCQNGHLLPPFKLGSFRVCRTCNLAWQKTDVQKAKKREWRNNSHWKEYRREWRRKRRELGLRPT